MKSRVRTVPIVHSSEVERIPWPGEQSRRVALAAEGLPRLLLVDDEAAPPVASDDLEDWVRQSARPDDIEARVLGLVRRATALVEDRPRVDRDGVLRHGRQWVALPPVEARLAEALIDRIGAVASRDGLERAGWPDGCPGRNALDVHMHRLRSRFTEIGLTVRTIRARGYLLDL